MMKLFFKGELDFEDVLTVHPTELNIPLELNKKNYSCSSIKLTNKTDRIVAYKLWPSLSIQLVTPDEATYVGTILPRSTSSVTVKLGRRKNPPGDKKWIDIEAYTVKDGVKAENITRENLYGLAEKKITGPFRIPVVYYSTAPPAANSSSPVVPEKNGKNGKNPFQPFNNNKLVVNSTPPAELVIPTTGGGYGSTSQRKSKATRVKPSSRAMIFSPKEIQDATNNFSKSLIIGQGGYGKVYKCQLDNWDVAVKILDDEGNQGLKEYIKEMEGLEGMRNENLIHLMGTCFKFRALVYEYLPNGSLEDCLKDRPEKLIWKIRTRIVYQICTALRFFHAEKPKPLVHGDLKPHNVLLDANFNVKLTDFGLCRYLTQGKNSMAFHNTLNVSGSAGYIDPDYLESGKVTRGIDVYSFGKTVVKILTGKYPPDIFREVHEANKKRSLMDIVDPAVRRWPENIVGILARFALKASTRDRYKSEFMENFHSELEKIL